MKVFNLEVEEVKLQNMGGWMLYGRKQRGYGRCVQHSSGWEKLEFVIYEGL